MSCLVSKKEATLSFSQPRETAMISPVSMSDWSPIVSSARHMIVTQSAQDWRKDSWAVSGSPRQCYTDPRWDTQGWRSSSGMQSVLVSVPGFEPYGQPEGNGHLWRRNQSAVYLETGDLIQIERIGSRKAPGYRGGSQNNKSAGGKYVPYGAWVLKNLV